MNNNRSHSRRWQFVLAAGLLLIGARLSFSDDATDDWKAPARMAGIKNPVPADAAAIDAGKKIYLNNCLACHGVAGKGDGPAAIACNPHPKDLSDPKIASQADGELFYKITEGKKPMPTYRKLLSENDRWTVIDYVRTLAPQAPTTAPSGG